MLMNAKQFCTETGFPVAMIRRLCRLGILPYWKCGRVYLLDFDRTIQKLELLKEQNYAAPYMQPLPVPRQRKQNGSGIVTDVLPGETGTERLKNLLRQRREQRKKCL